MAWTNGHTRTSTTKHRQWALTVKRRDHYRCVKCGYQGTPGKADVEADHIRNQAAGGTETLGNGQTLCIPCHQAKTRTEAATGRARYRGTPQPEPHPGAISGPPRPTPAPWRRATQPPTTLTGLRRS